MAKKTHLAEEAEGKIRSFCSLYHWCKGHKGRFDVGQFCSDFKKDLVSLGEADNSESFKSDLRFSTKEPDYGVVNRAMTLCESCPLGQFIE